MLIFSKNVNKNDLDKRLQNRLSNFNFYLKGEYTVTSGLRTVEHNREVGGVADSSHLRGLAVDIECRTSQDAFIIISTAMVAGFNRIGYANDHIHLDVDNEKVAHVIWLE